MGQGGQAPCPTIFLQFNTSLIQVIIFIIFYITPVPQRLIAIEGRQCHWFNIRLNGKILFNGYLSVSSL